MGTQDHLSVINSSKLKTTYGGLSITASLIRYATQAFNTIYDIGRGFGSSLRRIKSKNLCKF